MYYEEVVDDFIGSKEEAELELPESGWTKKWLEGLDKYTKMREKQIEKEYFTLT